MKICFISKLFHLFTFPFQKWKLFSLLAIKNREIPIFTNSFKDFPPLFSFSFSIFNFSLFFENYFHFISFIFSKFSFFGFHIFIFPFFCGFAAPNEKMTSIQSGSAAKEHIGVSRECKNISYTVTNCYTIGAYISNIYFLYLSYISYVCFLYWLRKNAGMHVGRMHTAKKNKSHKKIPQACRLEGIFDVFHK